MKEAMEKFENAVNELMDMSKRELGQIVFEEDMDDRAISVLRMSFNLVDASMELMQAQTKLMIEMNEKLDKLVEK